MLAKRIDNDFQTSLERMVEQGYVQVKQHAAADLWIYNYSPVTQFERYWNPVTLQCRGLILDGQGQIVARPLPKFFNLGEPEVGPLPHQPFEVYEKMDGSLGILYFWKGEAQIASRGSFHSKQALKANSLLYGKYRSSLAHLNPDYTYLFEIIYPENRIVVDYGDAEELVLLAVLETATGREQPLPDIGFPLPKRYDWQADVSALKERKMENKEGYIVRFKNGYRVKVKLERYMELHRIVTGISTKSIWEMLRSGVGLAGLLEQLPDEYYDWVKSEEQSFRRQYRIIEAQCRKDFKVLGSRKETAAYFLQCAYPVILFRMLDQRPYADLIWGLLKPSYERPFQ